MKDKKFRAPRIWSNRELAKFAHLFEGRVANISGWKDIDKEGRRYKDYFVNAAEYWVSNYKSDARGFQGNLDNEFFLDLSVPLNSASVDGFDVVFNHTVLEHIFEMDTAFSNLCQLTRDVVIVVVPFMQEQHADYGDYWRFTPQAIDKLFKKNGLKTLYISANDQADSSIYIFAVASKRHEKWSGLSDSKDNVLNIIYTEQGMIGRKFFGYSKILSYMSAIKKKLTLRR